MLSNSHRCITSSFFLINRENYLHWLFLWVSCSLLGFGCMLLDVGIAFSCNLSLSVIYLGK